MNQQQAGPPDEAFAAFIAVVLGAVCFAFLIGLAIQFFFARTVARCLDKCHPDAREMEPGTAYYIMIPIFSLYWAFRMTADTASTLDNEFEDRRWRATGDFGREVGKWWAICTVASIVPYIGAIPGIASLVLFIIYWIKIAEHSRELDSDDGPDPDYGRRRKRRRRDDDDEYDDDREDRR